MSRNEIVVDVPPAAVFNVLADGNRYADWVVGAKKVRHVEGPWPQPGARFHHTVGVGPLKIDDNTKVLELDPGHRLVLSARARPAGTARVVLTLEPVDGDRTRVVMEEWAESGPANLIPQRLLDPLTHVRNAEALRRLKNLAENETVDRVGAT